MRDNFEIISLDLNFKKTTVVLFEESTHLPANFAGNSITKEILQPLPRSNYKKEKLLDQNVETHFYVEPKIRKTIDEAFSSPVTIVHLSSLLIDYLYRTSQDKLLVFTASKRIHIVLSNQSGLRFYNAYPFTSPEDFLYWILAVVEMHQIDINRLPVILSGRIGKEGPIPDLLKNYIPDLSYPPLAHWKTDLELDKYMYLDLYLANLCV